MQLATAFSVPLASVCTPPHNSDNIAKSPFASDGLHDHCGKGSFRSCGNLSELDLSSIGLEGVADKKENHGSPDLRISTRTAQNHNWCVGCAWVQGYRPTMEDAYVMELMVDGTTGLLGVFDGHGGHECAEFCAAHVADILQGTPGWAEGDIQRSLKEAFLALDVQLTSRCPPSSGTTCTLAVLQGSKMMVAGVGDSKCIMFHHQVSAPEDSQDRKDKDSVGTASSHGSTPFGSQGNGGCGLQSPKESLCSGFTAGSGRDSGGSASTGRHSHDEGGSNCHAKPAHHSALSMTVDHRPDTPEEEERIRGAGGFVHGGRINACLNVSRSLGDIQFKQDALKSVCEQQVSPMPDIRESEARSCLDFLLLCSDGIWNSMKDRVVLRFVKNKLAAGHDPSEICRRLCEVSMEPSRTAYDNATAMLCVFKPGCVGSREAAAPPSAPYTEPGDGTHAAPT